MRRFISFLGGILAIILILWGITSKMEAENNSGKKDSLVIFNWGDYIDPDLLEEFTQETGIKVEYQTFDSNEAMYAKLAKGGVTYDIAIPSEYMIAKMMSEDMLYPLDYHKIKGLENIDSKFLNQSFDPGNKFSIPYFWGTLGIIYNEKLVKTPPTEWADLWRDEYRNNIMLIDGAREGIGIGLQTLGYSVNSANQKELLEAIDLLYKLTPNIKAIVADEIKGYMIQGDAAVAVTFSGEASEMLEGNEDLTYVVPSKGSNLWFDNIVIPKTAKNIDAAYQFINFMLRPESARRNAVYVGYATPNKVAKAMLPEDVQNDQAFYPSGATLDNLEVYNNLGSELLGTYNDLYLQFKMYRK